MQHTISEEWSKRTRPEHGTGEMFMCKVRGLSEEVFVRNFGTHHRPSWRISKSEGGFPAGGYTGDLPTFEDVLAVVK